MKRVLVLSDNEIMLDFIISLINSRENDGNFSFIVACSPRSPLLKEQNGILLEEIDLKDTKTQESVSQNFDLMINVHGKQIVPKKILEEIICINVHPGYNPFNRGFFPQVFSIINSFPVGVTVHLMNETIDGGPIIWQEEIVIAMHDTSREVYEKILNVEKKFLIENFDDLLVGNFYSTTVGSKGNYNSYRDFLRLCSLDLKSRATLGEHINLLRALTHGDFKNAFFFNTEGKKVFVRIQLEVEGNSN